MALTIARVTSYREANKQVRVCDVTFDASYPTAGEPLTPANVGLKKIEQAIPHGPARNTAGTLGVGVAYNYATEKLFAYETGGVVSTPLAEVGSTESLATYVVRITFIGWGTG